MQDFKRLQTDPPAGISGAPLENDIITASPPFLLPRHWSLGMPCNFLLMLFAYVMLSGAILQAV
jgi:hypothetical protein